MVLTANLNSLLSQSSPEIQVLLTCLHLQPEAEKIEQLKSLLQQEIDWVVLTQFVRIHRVIPLVYGSLKAVSDLIPEKILAQLQLDFRLSNRRSLLLSGELVRLLNVFEEQEIAAIPFKGVVLAAAAYGNLSMRQFNDLDILIHEEDIEKGKSLFLAEGYRMKIERIELTPEQEEIFVRSPDIYHFVREAAYPFIHKQKGIVAELHWSTMPKYFSYPIDTEELWNNRTVVTIAGKAVPTFSPENTLLMLIGHGTKECWTQLARICDIAYLINRHSHLNWQALIQQAQRQGGHRMLLLGLRLADELLGVSLPENVQQQIDQDTALNSICEEIYKNIIHTQESSAKDGITTRFHLKVREHLSDQVRYFLNVATTPTTTDWLVFPLAKFPRFPYYFIRPLRLIGEKVVRTKAQSRK